MQHGWHQMINYTVCYYQTPHNIALILEQVSNYNNLMRDQMNVEKVTHIIQNNMISGENIFASKLCATANECVPNEFDKKNKYNDIKVTTYNNWIRPKN